MSKPAKSKQIEVTETAGVNPPAGNLKLTLAMKQTFLKNLAECGSLAGASERTLGIPGISQTRTWKRLIRTEPGFGRAVAEALENYASRINDELNRSIFEGERVPVMFEGIQCKDESGNLLWITKKSDKLLLAVARATNKNLREVRTVVNQQGDPVDLEPTLRIRKSDLWCLHPHEVEQILAIHNKIIQHHGMEESDLELKAIHQNGEAEDIEFSESDGEPEIESELDYTIPEGGL